MYRGVAGDPLSSPFLTAQPASTPWIDLFFPLLLLLALALMIPSASTGVAALDTISPSSSAPQQPAYTPSYRVQLQETVRASAPSQSNGSASNSNANDSPPSYGFNRGFDKPYQKMTILIAVLLIATLLIGFCTHYVTLQSCRVRREREGDAEAQGGGQGANEGAGRGGGLDQWIVRSLPTVRYSVTNRMKEEEEDEAGEGKKGGEAILAMAMVKQECAVCLSEFEEGEEMKALPECGHAFHSACIDMWLFSHTTCPICRLSLLKPRSSSKRKPAAASRSPSRGDRLHVAVTVQQSADPTMSASTSTGPRHVTPTWPAHLDDDVAEDARDSSAALYPHLPSS